jgi:hypothetical protein
MLSRRIFMDKLLMVVTAMLLVTALSGPVHAGEGSIPAREVLSAIDVADLIKSGAADADIAKALSRQHGFDRESALKNGQTDQQIITGLITGAYASKKPVDMNNSIRHKFEADRLYKGSQYEKAASEYTLAIITSEDNVALYKSRGDSYRQYLATKKPASFKDEAQAAQLDRSRKVICSSIYSDYKNALKKNNETLQALESRLIILKADMSSKKMPDQARGNVAPYHYRAAGNIQGMREMDRLYRSQRAARRNELDLKKAMGEYKQVCGKEYAELRKSIMIEKDRKREKRWVPYAIVEEAGHYYDKSSLEKAKDELNVWTLFENIAGEQTDVVALIRMNCNKKTMATIESATYDEFGKLIKKGRHDAALKKVLPGTIDEKLIKEVCR